MLRGWSAAGLHLRPRDCLCAARDRLARGQMRNRVLPLQTLSMAREARQMTCTGRST